MRPNAIGIRWGVTAILLTTAILGPSRTVFAGELDVPLYYDALSKIHELESQSQFDLALANLLILERQIKNARPKALEWILQETNRRYRTLIALKDAPELQATYAELRELESRMSESNRSDIDVKEPRLKKLTAAAAKLAAVDPGAVARHRLLLAREKRHLDDEEDAVVFAEQALDLIEREYGRPHPLAGKALNALGSARRELGRTAAAVSAYESAREEFELCGLQITADYVGTLEKLGNIARKEQRLDAAKDWFLRAAKIADELKVEKALAESSLYLQMAQSRDIFSTTETLDWAEKGERASRQINPPEPQVAACCIHVRGRCLNQLGEPAKAEADFCKSFAIFEKTGNLPLQAGVLLELAEIYLKFEYYEDAARAMESADAVALRAGGGVLKYVRARRVPVAASLGRANEVERLEAETKQNFPDTPDTQAAALKARLRLAVQARDDERTAELGRQVIALEAATKSAIPDESLSLKTATAGALQRLGQTDAAVKLANEVLKAIEPDWRRRDPWAALIAVKTLEVLRKAGEPVEESFERDARNCLADKCKFEFKLTR